MQLLVRTLDLLSSHSSSSLMQRAGSSPQIGIYLLIFAGFHFASSTVVVAVVVVVYDATGSRNCFVGDCELLVRGYIIEDDVPIAT